MSISVSRAWLECAFPRRVLLFVLRWVILEKVLHRLVQVFEVLVWVLLEVDYLGHISTTDQLPSFRVVEAYDERPDRNGRSLALNGTVPKARSSATPSRAEQIQAQFIMERSLATHLKVTLSQLRRERLAKPQPATHFRNASKNEVFCETDNNH